MTERITENIVRDLLREKGYYDDKNIIIEEQKSQNPKIDKLLKNASKSGNGCGYPEFIISFKNKPDDLIVIECKKDTFYHESKDRKQYKDYAVDGALLYASFLQKQYNTTAISVSGTNDKDKKNFNIFVVKRTLHLQRHTG
jgi:type I restriction enzyme M protein